MAGDFVYSDPGVGKVYHHVGGSSTQIGPTLAVESVEPNDIGKRRHQSRVCYWGGSLYCLQAAVIYTYDPSGDTWDAVTVVGDTFNAHQAGSIGCSSAMFPMSIEGVNYLCGYWTANINTSGQDMKVDFFKITTAGVLTNLDVSATVGSTDNYISPSQTIIGAWSQYILQIFQHSTSSSGGYRKIQAYNTVDGTLTSLTVGEPATVVDEPTATYVSACHWQNRMVVTFPIGGAGATDAAKGIHLYSFDGTWHDHGQIADAHTDMAWASTKTSNGDYGYEGNTSTDMFVDPATGDLILIYPKSIGAATSGADNTNRHYSVGCLKFSGTLAGNVIGAGGGDIAMADIQTTVFSGIQDYDNVLYTAPSTSSSVVADGANRWRGDYHWTSWADNYTTPGTPAVYIMEHRCTDEDNTECRVLKWAATDAPVVYQSSFTGNQIAPPASINRNYEGSAHWHASRENIEIVSVVSSGAGEPNQMTITFDIWGPTATDKVVKFYFQGDDTDVYGGSNNQTINLVNDSSLSVGHAASGHDASNSTDTITGLTTATGASKRYSVRWEATTDNIGVYEKFSIVGHIT